MKKRAALNEMEHRHDIDIILVPDPAMETPQYKLRRIRLSESTLGEYTRPSYRLPMQAKDADAGVPYSVRQTKGDIEEPKIKRLVPQVPVPNSKGRHSSFVLKVFRSLFGGGANKAPLGPSNSGGKPAQRQRRGGQRPENTGRRRGNHPGRAANNNRKCRAHERKERLA